MCNKMSDVRLSNASPTLERVDPARIIGLAALQDGGGGGGSRPPVRRNLFGSPDPEELQREWGALMAEERRRFAEQWSYDPVADRPLTGGDVPPGGCRWEEATDAPDFYRRAPHEKRRPDGNRNDNNRGGSGDAGRPAERSSSSSSPSPGGDSSNSPDDSPRRRRQRASAGPCSGDSPRKRLRCDDHDEEEEVEEEGEDGQSNCTTTTARTVTSVVEETPSKADNSREQLG